MYDNTGRTAKGFGEVNYFKDYFNFKFNQKVMTEKDQEQALIETQKNLTLPISIIQSGLKTFCKVANRPHFDFTELDLMDREIYTLNGIERYAGLQTINASKNKLTGLEILSNHKFLVKIDASFNMLKNMLDFKPSECLVH